LKLWEIETKQLVWTAKNVPHDFLDMRVPIWINDLEFLTETPDCIALVSAYHQIQLYDIRKQRRPTINISFGEDPLMRIAVTPRSSNSILFSDNKGRIMEMDLRKGGAPLLGGYKGATGSVRALASYSLSLTKNNNNNNNDNDNDNNNNVEVVVSCGLDRFFRVHGLKKRNLMKQIYLKQRLNCVLISELQQQSNNDNKMEEEEDEEEEEDANEDEEVDEKENEDDDKVWDLLDNNKNKNKNKKRKIK